jgi:hypothetical protein
MLVIVKILAAAFVLVFAILLCTGLHAFAAALKRSRSDPEASARPCLRLLMALACGMFVLPFAVIIGRWAQTGGLDILSVEIILVTGPPAAALAYALAAGRRENKA